MKKFSGIKIEHSDINYFDAFAPIPNVDQDEIVFFKPDFFLHEAEYRVVIRMPERKKKFKTKEGLIVPIFIDGESMHLTISHLDPLFNNNYLCGGYPRTE